MAAATQQTPSAADYVVTAVSPTLIMALVGSLVFFLIEVLYVGQYTSQLQWGLFFFVFAAVLIARISIQSDKSGRAGVYGIALAIPVWLTLQFYVEYPTDSPLVEWKWLVNLVLMGLTWWCAHKLTWDCTFLDEEATDGGRGLLDASGLQQQAPEEEDEDEPKKPLTWWQRYQRYQDAQKKKHTPGVWVVYFSLAALPLFGLGQSLIPPDEAGRRQYVFWLLVIYVGSGLGLLLTTCFLGLRRYLRQKNLRMPAAMTGAWLTTGGVLIVLLLAAAALLPWPSADYPIVGIPLLGSKDRDASKWAMKDGSPGKGQGRPSSEMPKGTMRGDVEGKGKGAEGGKNAGDPKNKTGDGKDDPNGKSGGGKQDGKKDGEGGGKDDGKKGGDAGSQKGRQEAKATGKQDGNAKSGQPKNANEKQSGDRQDDSSADKQNSNSQSLLATLKAITDTVAPILKWVVFALLAAVAVFVIVRAFLQFLANFTNWAKSLLDALSALWKGLFGWWGVRESEGEVAVLSATGGKPPRPFASYRNPFADGTAGGMSPEETVRYTFAAFEAWAYERDLGRRADETPLEFARRVGDEAPALEEEAGQLVNLFARAAYARGPLPADALPAVEAFWEKLEAVVARPLSA